MRLEGRAALITGGAKGIGKGIAVRFAEEGAHVLLVDTDRAEGEETARSINAKGGSAEFRQADLSSEEQVRELVAALSGLDIVVNNVGLTGSRSVIDQTSFDHWNRIISINLSTLFLMCKYAVPLLRQSPSASIVNVASVNAYTMVPGLSAYSASKGGVLAITKQLAVECAPVGIRVNSVSPSLTFKDDRAKLSGSPAASDNSLDCYPLGRFAAVRDVANAVLFMASDEAAFITGQDLVIDGGMTAQSVSAVVRDDLRAGWKPGVYRLTQPETGGGAMSANAASRMES